MPDVWDLADMHIAEIGRLFDASGAEWPTLRNPLYRAAVQSNSPAPTSRRPSRSTDHWPWASGVDPLQGDSPSRRRQVCAITASVSALGSNPGVVASARSQNYWTAGDFDTASVSTSSADTAFFHRQESGMRGTAAKWRSIEGIWNAVSSEPPLRVISGRRRSGAQTQTWSRWISVGGHITASLRSTYGG